MPLTMAAPKCSRVQVQGRPKGHAKTEKKFNGVHKLVTTTTHGLKRESKAAAKNVRQRDQNLGQRSAVDLDAAVFYDDSDDDVGTLPTTFSKRRVPSRADLAESGSFESQLRPFVMRPKPSVVKVKPTTEHVQPRSYASTHTAPRRPTSEEAKPGQHLETPLPPLVPPERIPAPISWHQTLVNLFAGRKKSPKPSGSKHKRIISDPTSLATPGKLTPNQIQQLRQGTSEPATSPPASLPPRFTHRQTIPPIQQPNADHPSRRSGYHVVNPAPQHKYTGHAAAPGDTSEPTHIQHDFSGTEDGAVPPLQIPRGHSASKLLDRDGDVWAKFYAKNPYFGTVPMARTQSTSGTARRTGGACGDVPDRGGAASVGRLNGGCAGEGNEGL